jgi:hypothetical protein
LSFHAFSFLAKIAYGMYDTAVARYKGLLAATKTWDSKKTYEENMTNLNDGNPMRSLDDEDTINLSKLLEDHYDPRLAETRIRQVHSMLGGGSGGSGTTNALLTESERKEIGWDAAYDLRPWPEYSDTENVSPRGLWLQNWTGSWLGCGGGPTTTSEELGLLLRQVLIQQVRKSESK